MPNNGSALSLTDSVYDRVASRTSAPIVVCGSSARSGYSPASTPTYSPLSIQRRSSAARSTANGWLCPCSESSLSTLSRRSPTASYSAAWARNDSTSISPIREPPASFIRARSAASGSWQTSSPARSAESSDLRAHSSNAVTTARTPRAPSGTQATRDATRTRWKSRVR